MLLIMLLGMSAAAVSGRARRKLLSSWKTSSHMNSPTTRSRHRIHESPTDNAGGFPAALTAGGGGGGGPAPHAADAHAPAEYACVPPVCVDAGPRPTALGSQLDEDASGMGGGGPGGVAGAFTAAAAGGCPAAAPPCCPTPVAGGCPAAPVEAGGCPAAPLPSPRTVIIAE